MRAGSVVMTLAESASGSRDDVTIYYNRTEYHEGILRELRRASEVFIIIIVSSDAHLACTSASQGHKPHEPHWGHPISHPSQPSQNLICINRPRTLASPESNHRIIPRPARSTPGCSIIALSSPVHDPTSWRPPSPSRASPHATSRQCSQQRFPASDPVDHCSYLDEWTRSVAANVTLYENHELCGRSEIWARGK